MDEPSDLMWFISTALDRTEKPDVAGSSLLMSASSGLALAEADGQLKSTDLCNAQETDDTSKSTSHFNEQESDLNYSPPKKITVRSDMGLQAENEKLSPLSSPEFLDNPQSNESDCNNLVVDDQSSEATLLADKLESVCIDPSLFEKEKKLAGDEDMSDVEWLNEHLDKVKLHLQEELERLDGDINSDYFDTGMGDDDVNSQDDSTAEQLPPETDPDMLPIYAGAAITVAISFLLIMTYAIRHSLSGEALSDLLTLINIHCPAPNHIAKTLYMFKKHFQNLKSPITFHNYCSNCLISIPDKNQKVCQNVFCNQSFEKLGSLSFFIELPLQSQLQNLFSHTWFVKALQHRFTRKKTDGNISDVYDGLMYKKHFENNGILSDIRNISFIYNTDGVPVFKSSNFQIWPLFLAINELSPDQRFKMDNVLLAGLWFGNCKPCMLTYLRPFHSSLFQLEDKGIQLILPNGDTILSKSLLLMGSCDLPAKAAVCNCVQFNGFYGCFQCKQPGASVKTAKGGGDCSPLSFQHAKSNWAFKNPQRNFRSCKYCKTNRENNYGGKRSKLVWSSSKS